MTTALAAPPASAAAELLLVRMALPNATPKKVREDIGKLLNADWSAATFEELRSDLAAAGLLAKGKRNKWQ